MQDTLFRHTYTVTAADLNQYGILHGGRLLTLCDEAGFVSAFRHAKRACLTRAVHRAQFHSGARQGEELLISAKVGLTGQSSIWVPVNVTFAKDNKPVMDAVFVFVAINDKQKACQTTPAIAVSEAEHQTQKMLESLRQQLHSNES